MKKKLLICLAMLVSILGLTGCGSEMTENSFTTKEQAKENAEAFCEDLGGMQQAAAADGKTLDVYAEEYAEYTKSSQFAQTLQMFGLTIEDVEADINAHVEGVKNFGDVAEEFGNYVSVLKDETEVVLTEDKATVTVKMQGDKVYKGNKQRTATVEIVMVQEGKQIVYDTITVSTDYDMSELMTKAALNTLLGMGTVFAVLILIYGLISCFNIIPKIQKKFEKKTEQQVSAQVPVRAAEPAAVPEETDDTELIAVIAAAIAASEGAVSADGYVVRSIIRRA